METGALLLGRYRLTGRLGAGGAASVWAATDEQLRRTVAIKKLHAPSETGDRRFQREARLGAELRHPGLVTVHDIATDSDGHVLLVMEHVDGASLDVRLRDGALEPEAAVSITEQVAAALDHAHAHGIVHRDVKPANILVAGDGRALLADLGIAKGEAATALTAKGAILGTPAYMAPERIDGEGAGAASDVYALAAVAFEMLAGRPAHSGRMPLFVLESVLADPAPDLRAVAPAVPVAAAEAVAHGMARDPAARPATATAFADALATAFETAAGR